MILRLVPIITDGNLKSSSTIVRASSLELLRFMFLSDIQSFSRVTKINFLVIPSSKSASINIKIDKLFIIFCKIWKKNFSIIKGLLKIIDKGFYGDIKKLLQTIVGVLLDSAGYFAIRIIESVKGLGINDFKLDRIMYLEMKLICHILSNSIK